MSANIPPKSFFSIYIGKPKYLLVTLPKQKGWKKNEK
jgi:hypothetical protein